MRWHPHSSRRRRLLVATAAISLAGLIAPQPALSHPEGPGNHKPMPVHATPAMRAFIDDHHHADPLESASGQACIDGLAAETFPCDNIDLEAFLPIAEIGGTSGQSAAQRHLGLDGPGDRSRVRLDRPCVRNLLRRRHRPVQSALPRRTSDPWLVRF